jgi:hypothetical protein
MGRSGQESEAKNGFALFIPTLASVQMTGTSGLSFERGGKILVIWFSTTELGRDSHCRMQKGLRTGWIQHNHIFQYHPKCQNRKGMQHRSRIDLRVRTLSRLPMILHRVDVYVQNGNAEIDARIWWLRLRQYLNREYHIRSFFARRWFSFSLSTHTWQLRKICYNICAKYRQIYNNTT